MSGRGKGGKGLGKGGTSVTVRLFVITSKVSLTPTNVVVVTHIHSRYHKAHYSLSCSPWWCQAYFLSYLWGDLWCLEDLLGECESPCSSLFYSVISHHHRSIVTPSHTLSMKSGKLSHLLMLSTHRNDQYVCSIARSYIFSCLHLFPTVSAHSLVCSTLEYTLYLKIYQSLLCYLGSCFKYEYLNFHNVNLSPFWFC